MHSIFKRTIKKNKKKILMNYKFISYNDILFIILYLSRNL